MQRELGVLGRHDVIGQCHPEDRRQAEAAGEVADRHAEAAVTVAWPCSVSLVRRAIDLVQALPE